MPAAVNLSDRSTAGRLPFPAPRISGYFSFTTVAILALIGMLLE
jgi:hypothetical protein